MTNFHNNLPNFPTHTSEVVNSGMSALPDVHLNLGNDATQPPSTASVSNEQFPKGTIKAVWENEDGNVFPTLLTLYIPEVDAVGRGASFGAELVDYEDEEMGKILRAGTLGVDEKLRGAGYGERLVRALGYIGVEQDCDEIEVDFSHPASLKHFMNVYGPNRIELYDDNKKVLWTAQETITEINIRRASRAKVITADGNSHVNLAKVGISAGIDLKGLDTTGWEAPIIQDAAQAPWNTE